MNISPIIARLPWIDSTVSSWSAEARWLRWLTMSWLGIGLMILFSASYAVSLAEHGHGLHYVLVQLLWVGIGLVLFNRIVHTPLDTLAKLSGTTLLLMLGLVLPRMRGITFSTYMIIQTLLGLGIGPYMVGMVADQNGGDLGQAIISVNAVVPLLVLVLIVVLIRYRRDEASILDRARAGGEVV